VGITSRPYIGTWQLNNKELVQCTPDCLVYLNGDLTIPGNFTSDGARRINFQRYITSVSTDAGVEPGSLSANISLSIPVHSTDPFVQDANLILRTGLEVHIYMRGYFPVRGLFRYVTDFVEQDSGIATEGDVLETEEIELSAWEAWNSAAYDYAIAQHRPYDDSWMPGSTHAKTLTSVDCSDFVSEIELAGLENSGLMSQVDRKRVPTASAAVIYQESTPRPAGDIYNTVQPGDIIAMDADPNRPSADPTNFGKSADHIVVVLQDYNGGLVVAESTSRDDKGTTVCPLDQWLATWTERTGGAVRFGAATPKYISDLQKSTQKVTVAKGKPLSKAVRQKRPSDDLLSYPYYPVFHGVVTQVDLAYSSGFQTATLNCASMLHFWSYLYLATSGSFFGQRGRNANVKTTLEGHNFTDWHPYEIMYKLYRDTLGSQQSVSYQSAKKTNVDASSAIGQGLYSLTLDYWTERFKTTFMNFRMHGTTGYVFNSAQASFLANTKRDTLRALFSNRGLAKEAQMMQTAALLGIIDPSKKSGIEAAKIRQYGQLQAGFETNIFEMVAFVKDIGQQGSVNLWETTYETKMNLAQRVCEVTGFEFFQDVDGDLVFKPPMFNLDTSESRIYRLEDIDIISFSMSEREPECTYMVVKGSSFKNQIGLGLENEWGVGGTFIDYRLVAQYGWREQSFESYYLNSPGAMLYAAATRMDVMNVGRHYASATIPYRPEIRPGYPFYIPYLDCYYYCNSFNHSFQFGSQCTTTLQLVGKRSKFFAPGKFSSGGIEDIDLGNMSLPPKPLIVQDEKGQPKIKGFPNVVMALDPESISPLYSIAPKDADVWNLTSKDALKAILKLASVTSGAVTEVTEPTADGGKKSLGYYSYADVGGQKKYLYVGDAPADAPVGAVDLVAAANAYTSVSPKIVGAVGDLGATITALNLQIADAENEYQILSTATDISETVKASKQAQLLQTVSDLTTKRNQAQLDLGSMVGGEEVGPSLESINLIRLLLKLAGADTVSDRPGYVDLRSTNNLLGLLSDKKALFTVEVPGSFRYYSCAHPSLAHQGSHPAITLAGTIDSGKADLTPQRGYGFFPTNEIKHQEIGAKVNAQFGLRDNHVHKGLFVQTLTGKKAVPTSEITSLTFSNVKMDGTGISATRAKDKKELASNTRSLVYRGLYGAFLSSSAQAKTLSTIQNVLKPMWDAKAQILTKGGFTVGAFPSSVRIKIKVNNMSVLVTMSTTTALNDPKIGASTNEAAQNYCKSASDQVASSMASPIAKQYATKHAEAQTEGKTKFPGDTEKVDAYVAEQMKAMNAALFNINSLAVLTDGGTVGMQGGKSQTKQSPVFPVSDAAGYTVIGSMPWGRGVNISADGVFNQMLNTDPLGIVDKAVLDRYIRMLPLRGKKDDTGAIAKEFTDAEAALIKSLQETYSTQDLLDASIVSKDSTGKITYRVENFLADTGASPQKLPIVNAALSLADLNFHLELNDVSDLRMAEADVLMDAMSTDFVEIAKSQDMGLIQTFAEIPTKPDGSFDLDEPSRIALKSIADKRRSWELYQEILRGKAVTGGGTTAFEKLKSLGSVSQQLDQIEGIQESQKQALKQQTDQLSSDAKRLLEE